MNNTFVLPLNTGQATLENAGGKGANLARMIRAGFPVPGGFLVTTAAYLDFVRTNGLDVWIPAQFAGVSLDDPGTLEDLSRRIRYRFTRGELPPDLIPALMRAYAALGSPLVAVRSSATAEDLPEMSFAGQQDTFLNVLGEADLLAAVVDCWSSLWTARAIAYRGRHNISHENLALAIVVQMMVQSKASGVLFTANPLTGLRTETVIDATFGLGDALVSGLVEPDHYVVDTRRNEITEITLGAKGAMPQGQADAERRQALPDDQILALARLGAQVTETFRSPQDIEWAWADRRLYLLQARPITSLFPVPAGLGPEPLRVLISFAAVQGVVDPVTPLGQDVIRVLFAGGASLFGFRENHESQRVIYDAGERLWIDLTAVVHNSVGRRLIARDAFEIFEPTVGQALIGLLDDERLFPTQRGIRLRTLARLARFMVPFWRNVVRCWRDPDGQRTRIQEEIDARLADLKARSETITGGSDELARRVALIHALAGAFPFAVPRILSAMVAGLIPLVILRRLVGGESQVGLHGSHDAMEILRGMPHNVTTEMDLALWGVAQAIRADAESASRFQDASAEELAADCLASCLPAPAQSAIDGFLKHYGMRGLGEIDFGQPRWREDPTPLMQVLQSYLQIEDVSGAPDAVFARGQKAADDAAVQLEVALRRTRGGRLKAGFVRWAVRRIQALAGLRESPKFYISRMMGIVRLGLLEDGRELAAAGVLDRVDDLFFLRLTELEILASQWAEDRAALFDSDGVSVYRARIVERRAANAREKRRKQLPRVLLSDGIAVYEGMEAADDLRDGVFVGSPVSPGVVEGVARVVVDPHGAQLAPGEILVCHGTDPAWTPLFLTAGGLVMEVGGMMTHGSVVAREYGIPAVVGVHEATSRLQTGQRVRVDGSRGRIERLAEGTLAQNTTA